MCGICGFNWEDKELILSMCKELSHRGPDDEGIYVDEGVSLGHRRLSIIDLSKNGSQPMPNEDGSIWLIFNGEIYNFKELRELLEKKGHKFLSRTDSEVILHAYEEYGYECLNRLKGMFAFAIWNKNERELFIARDRIGIKPLYYTFYNNRLIFASEIKAILKNDYFYKRINKRALYPLIGFEFVPAPETLFDKVNKLMPGYYLVYKDGRIKIKRYWDLEFKKDGKEYGYYKEELVRKLEEAVRSHLISDVPLGVFLSGGIDSSSIVAFMRRCIDGEILSFSLGYHDKSYSEFEYAKRVADYFGTKHRELIIDPITPEVVEKVLWNFDEPMTDFSAIPFYMICKKAREYVKVCLSGEGGDEVFVGYDRFIASKIDCYYRKLPEWIRKGIISRIVKSLPDQAQKKGLINMLKRFVAGSELPLDGAHMRWQYFMESDGASKLFKELDEFDPFYYIRRVAENCKEGDRLEKEIYIDMRFTMPDSVLMKVDKMSMAHSLEVRVPFLDHEVVEFAASIPSHMKLKGFTTKAIFKDSMKNILPPGIAYRKKQGYSFPMKNWLRKELKDYMIDVLGSAQIIKENFNLSYINRLIKEHLNYTHNHSHVLWALISLAVWHKNFFNK